MNKNTPRTRLTPPMCMGQRMSGDHDRWFLKLEPIGLKVVVMSVQPDGGCEWELQTMAGECIEFDFATGQQAAANAAERWLVKRAELTLKLAGRRAAP